MKFLENIFSVKNEDCHKLINIFGIKFKIKSKIKILNKKNEIQEWFINSLLNSLRKEDADYFLKKTLNNDEFLKNVPINVIANILLKLKKSEGTYLKEHPDFKYIKNLIDEAQDYPALSNLLFKNDIKTERIEKLSFVYENFKKNNDNNSFLNYIENKTIAIVGNSGRELNTNNGSIIDSHDIVIRFGNYPKGYEKDYGKKTNVWFRGIGNTPLAVIDREDISDFDFVIWAYDIEFVRLKYNHLDILLRDMEKFPSKIIYMPKIWYKDLIEKYNIKVPTNGARLAYSIINSKKPACVDIYGFSFLDENSNDNSHYYDNECRLSFAHSIDEERDFMRKYYLEYKNLNKG